MLDVRPRSFGNPLLRRQGVTRPPPGGYILEAGDIAAPHNVELRYRARKILGRWGFHVALQQFRTTVISTK